MTPPTCLSGQTDASILATMNLDPVAKILIVLGFAFLLGGIAWQLGFIQSLKLGRLPGDISIERDGLRIYIPITTCLLISALLSLLAWIARALK